jgi:hypothetical protein
MKTQGDNPHDKDGIKIVAEEANVAHKLKYPRKIELTNLISRFNYV